MSKLDWSKAGSYEPDPARVQRVDDFVEPDRIVVSVRDLTAREKKKLARQQSRRGKARTKLKAALQRKSQAAKVKLPRREVSEKDKLLAAESRRIAKAEYHQRHIAKTRRELAAAAAKKKSHLEAWVEKQSGLRSDRKTLSQVWRAGMLSSPKK